MLSFCFLFLSFPILTFFHFDFVVVDLLFVRFAPFCVSTCFCRCFHFWKMGIYAIINSVINGVINEHRAINFGRCLFLRFLHSFQLIVLVTGN